MHPPELAISVQHANQSRVNSRDEYEDAVQALYRGQAQVRDVQHKGESSRVCLQFPEQRLQGIQVGASVAINGTCLTVSIPYMHTENPCTHMPASACKRAACRLLALGCQEPGVDRGGSCFPQQPGLAQCRSVGGCRSQMSSRIPATLTS